MSIADDLRNAGRELLEAEEAHRRSPTLENTSRLVRARRTLEALVEPPPSPYRRARRHRRRRPRR